MFECQTGLKAPLLDSDPKATSNGCLRIFVSILFLLVAILILELQHYRWLQMYLSESGDILHRVPHEELVGSFSSIVNDLMAIEKKKQDLKRTKGGVIPFKEAPLPLTCDKMYKEINQENEAVNYGCDDLMRYHKDGVIAVGNTLKKPDIYGMCHDYLYIKTVGMYGERYYMADIRYWSYNIWPIPPTHAHAVEKLEFTKQNNWVMGGGWIDVSDTKVTLGQLLEYVEELARKQAYVVKSFNCWDYINQLCIHFWGEERGKTITYGAKNRLYKVKIDEQKRGFRYKKYFPWMDEFGSTADEYIQNYFEPRYPPMNLGAISPSQRKWTLPVSPESRGGSPTRSDSGSTGFTESEEYPSIQDAVPVVPLQRVSLPAELESPRMSDLGTLSLLNTPRSGLSTPRSDLTTPRSPPSSSGASTPRSGDGTPRMQVENDPFSFRVTSKRVRGTGINIDTTRKKSSNIFHEVEDIIPMPVESVRQTLSKPP